MTATLVHLTSTITDGTGARLNACALRRAEDTAVLVIQLEDRKHRVLLVTASEVDRYVARGEPIDFLQHARFDTVRTFMISGHTPTLAEVNSALEQIGHDYSLAEPLAYLPEEEDFSATVAALGRIEDARQLRADTYRRAMAALTDGGQ